MSEMTTVAGNFGYSADKRRGALQKRTESADREKQVQEKDQGRGQTSLRYCCVRETGGVGAWGWALKGLGAVRTSSRQLEDKARRQAVKEQGLLVFHIVDGMDNVIRMRDQRSPFWKQSRSMMDGWRWYPAASESKQS